MKRGEALDLIGLVPGRTALCSPRRAEVLRAWLSALPEGGAGGQVPSGPASLFVAVVGAEYVGMYLVPDASISEAQRQSLDGAWPAVFAPEEVVHPGQLWFLAFTGSADASVLRWLGPALAIEEGALLAQAAAAEAHARPGVEEVATAEVSHAYAAWLK